MDRTYSYLIIQDADLEQIDYVEKAHTADFETAIHFSRNGKFQILLLSVCGVIYATCAMSTMALSFVLPSAECDFNLSSADKGKLSAMPLIGMVFGCSIWGSIADSKGRKIAIISALMVDFVAGFTSSFVGSLNLFMICRFFSGFGIIGATSLIFSYLGEFTSVKNRDVILGRLEIFWNTGAILLPGLGWCLLNPSFMDSFSGGFSPWRVFVLVCSLPSFISLVILAFLPETPKFLISKRRFSDAKAVFQRVYTFNTGYPEYSYPVMTLEGEYDTCNNNCDSTHELIETLGHKIEMFWGDLKSLITQPYLKYLSITSFADFGLMASYYTLIMWFPEIFERFNQYESLNPGTPASVCSASLQFVSNPNISFLDWEEPDQCNPSISNRVFLDTTIIALSCIPTSVTLSFFMRTLGKKTVLICGLVLAGLATLSLVWVQTFTQTLVLSSIFEALTSVLEAVIFCVIVDLFPTNLRGIAVAITATSGRIGAILGNVIFGLLIDLNCVVPIYIFGTVLIGSGMLCVAIPRSDQYLIIR